MSRAPVEPRPRDYYADLGVLPTDSTNEIKKSYISLKLIHNYDGNDTADSPNAVWSRYVSRFSPGLVCRICSQVGSFKKLGSAFKTMTSAKRTMRVTT